MKNNTSEMTILKKIFYFYVDGFKSMKLGKSLWLLIVIKLFILLVVVKWLFFPNFLETHFESDSERSDYILEQLTKER
jgi:flagellar basal body-associated protein FliL